MAHAGDLARRRRRSSSSELLDGAAARRAARGGFVGASVVEPRLRERVDRRQLPGHAAGSATRYRFTAAPRPARRPARRRRSAPPSPAARTSRLPTITPSARSPTARACAGVEMPNPTATGTLGRGAHPLDRAGQLGRQLVALARRARRATPCRRTRARRGRSRLSRSSVRRRRRQRHQRQPRDVAVGAQLGGLVVREVGHDQPRRARAAARRLSRKPSWPQHDVRVGHQHAPGSARRAPAHTSSTHSGVAPAASARVPAAWITGPSASGSENGTPELDEVGARVGAREARIARGVERREAAHQVRHQRRALPWPANAAAIRSAAGLGRLGIHRPSTSARSLSPRPESVIRSIDDPSRVREHPRERVRGLERRHDPLEPRDQLERGQRLVVGRRRS